MDIQDLDIVDNNNQQNWPEGTMKVQDVNDAGRADEGLLARWFADWNGSKITAGTGSAYTAASDTSPTAYYDGLQFVLEIHADCLADATLNVDSLGAATIKKNGTENLAAGDLVAGMVALFVYRGTDWNLVSAVKLNLGTAASKDTGTDIGDVVEVVDVGSGQAGVDPSLLPSAWTYEAVQATTSGTFVEWTSLPTGIQEIEVIMSAVSFADASHFVVELGDSGGYETTGYVSQSNDIDAVGGTATIDFTGGYISYAANANKQFSGTFRINLLDSSANRWIFTAQTSFSDPGAAHQQIGTGTKALTAVLDRVKVRAGASGPYNNGQMVLRYR